jgi:uncharacterized membrane protein
LDGIPAHGRGGITANLAFVVSLIGLAISIYLTYEHVTGSKSFACPATSTVNCEKVTTSAWSVIAGIPVAVLGLIFFVAMTLLTTPYAWRFRQLDWLRVLGALTGIATALYLVWAELFRIDAICLWCTGVHVCTVVLLGLVLWATSQTRAAADLNDGRLTREGSRSERARSE